jgi:DNA transposition AAA+ family ATPase
MHTNSLPPSDRDESTAVFDPPAAKSDAHYNSLATIQRARQQVAGDIVNNATKDLPDNQRSAIRRFHAYYVENALTLDEAAKLIRREGPTLSLVFNGQYQAKLDSIVEEIESFFTLQHRRGFGRKLEFIETSLTRRIWALCEAALEFQRIGFIFGDQQIGKSEALESFQRAHNHGNTIYTFVPAGGLLSDFLYVCAQALRISHNQRRSNLRQRIKDAIDDRMLLIVDELHLTVDDSASKRAVQTVEFIREIFNQKKCGLVCCGTNVFRDEMEAGDLQKILRQFKRRRLCTLQLPSVPTQEDLNTFAHAYGLKPATGDARKLQTDVIEHEALGMWLTLLRMASKVAAKSKQKMDWAHVLSAHKGLMALEGGAA